MLSIPPATTIAADPATMASCASIVAFIPEPHILLTVVAPAAVRNAGKTSGLAGGRLAQSGRQDTTHDDFVDRVGGKLACVQRRA